MQDNAEIELIAHSKQGDRAAMAELFGLHYKSSLRLARGILRCEDASQDAVQAAYFSAFQHLHTFRGDACFKTWIASIVLNCCRMKLREFRRRATWVSLDEPGAAREPRTLASSGPTPETAAWRLEVSSALSDAVSRLPKHLREAYAQSISGLSLREVAATLGITVTATKTRLFRARAGLRLHLKPMWSNARSRGAVALSKSRRG